MDEGAVQALWDGWNESRGPRYPHEKVVQFVMRNFPSTRRAGVRALDLGCGSGVHTAFLAQLGFDVTGVDASAVGLANTADLCAEAGATVSLQQALLSTFEADEGSFDCLLCVGVLDAAGLEEARAAAPRIVQCLRPGGKALLIFAAEGDFRIAVPSDLGLHGYSRGQVEELFRGLDKAECWIDQYITTYENERIRQVDWLVTLAKK